MLLWKKVIVIIEPQSSLFEKSDNNIGNRLYNNLRNFKKAQ